MATATIVNETVHPLKSAIEDKTAKIGIVGLGYVGLPLVQAFVSSGFTTFGFDVDQAKIDRLFGSGFIESCVRPRAALSSIPRPRCDGQVASAERVHRQGSPFGRHSRGRAATASRISW
jgi:hypothetical protein